MIEQNLNNNPFFHSPYKVKMSSRAERAYNKAETAFAEAKKQKEAAYTVYIEAYTKKEAAHQELSNGYTKERLTNYRREKEAMVAAAEVAEEARKKCWTADRFAELKMRQFYDFKERDAWRKSAPARKAERLAAAAEEAAKAAADAQALADAKAATDAKAAADAQAAVAEPAEKVVPPVLKPLSQQQVTDLGSLIRSFLGF